MSLYRTVSDRGLWKKYQKTGSGGGGGGQGGGNGPGPQPQHFHKPKYIDKETPVVTYSQLDLGDPYRYTSRYIFRGWSSSMIFTIRPYV